ncbi:MAG TPA: S-adenosylmethionine:tRNA ribosyltransferase-isomerase [Bacteroidales bacterium]|nr:S-adenosylmethionine:tRNA ribosyltransferase-isomerase [Bacteroidales bacterium]
MTDPRTIRISDYDYPLPPERIAQSPLEVRDTSRLLVVRPGEISEDVFKSIGDYLPAGSLLVFNNTRVVHARLLFRKETGAQVEIFCLEPLAPEKEIQAAFRHSSGVTWKCLVGNLKRWKSGSLALEAVHDGKPCRLYAGFAGDAGDGAFRIEFSWEPSNLPFSAILEAAGKVPLPPYITRPAGPGDEERYQTVFARYDGSVAAPTAGLHFTGAGIAKLQRSGFDTAEVTLHVGAGTFRPVTTPLIGDHPMHHENMVVPRSLIARLASGHQPVVAVGTTAARTLESLFWAGIRILQEGDPEDLSIGQWEPYEREGTEGIRLGEALEALLGYLDRRGLDSFTEETRLLIAPGYTFRVISGLITNFHLPQSTLLLLIAALAGNSWRDAYSYALGHDFRFLSYGDSCFFLNPLPVLR